MNLVPLMDISIEHSLTILVIFSRNSLNEDPRRNLCRLSSVRGNYSISSVHKNEKNPPKVYILIKYNHCVLLTHPLVRIELFFMLWLFHFKKFLPLYHFFQIFDHTYHFSDPLPLFTTRPLLITPYHFPHILTPYLFRGPPYNV